MVEADKLDRVNLQDTEIDPIIIGVEV